MRIPFTIVAILSVSGCSLVLVDGPPRPHPTTPGEVVACSENSAWPTVDYIAAGTYALGAAASLASGDLTESEAPAFAVSGVIWATIHFVSARKGKARIRQCRAAKREMLSRMPRAETPPTVTPPGSSGGR